MEVIKDTKKPEPRKPRFGLVMDPYIKFYDLESGVLDFAKVRRSYGIPDMYKDVDHERVYHVKELLSKLESDAAIIYHRLKKVHESGKRNFSIARRERNILRKFLFVMKYRSQKFWSKYTGTIDAYEHSDRSRLLEFLKERSITDLRQVWLLNLEVIIRTEIDPDGEWLQTIGREMFGGDAEMYCTCSTCRNRTWRSASHNPLRTNSSLPIMDLEYSRALSSMIPQTLKAQVPTTRLLGWEIRDILSSTSWLLYLHD